MKRLSKNSRYFIIVVGAGLLILLAVGLKNRVTVLRQLREEAEVVDAEVASLEATRAVLQTEIAYATSVPAVEEWAYTEARLKKDGDTLIVPISPHDSTPTPSVAEEMDAEPMENWEAWRALFFDPLLP